MKIGSTTYLVITTAASEYGMIWAPYKTLKEAKEEINRARREEGVTKLQIFKAKRLPTK